MQMLEEHTQGEYKYGFSSNIDMETLPKGLNEDIVRAISAKKNEPEFLTEWRLKSLSTVVGNGRARLGKR